MSYKKNKYKIIKNAIPIDVANFVNDYFVLKRQVHFTLKESTYISRGHGSRGHDPHMETRYCRF